MKYENNYEILIFEKIDIILYDFIYNLFSEIYFEDLYWKKQT